MYVYRIYVYIYECNVQGGAEKTGQVTFGFGS